MKAKTVLIALLAAAPAAYAVTPAQMQAGFETEARRNDPKFAASAERGRQFFLARHSGNRDQQACTTCHTDNAAGDGKHYKTGKLIKPLAPAANPTRFTDLAKSEKWFGRNCSEVVGRPCSAAEKADFIAFLTSLR